MACSRLGTIVVAAIDAAGSTCEGVNAIDATSGSSRTISEGFSRLWSRAFLLVEMTAESVIELFALTHGCGEGQRYSIRQCRQMRW